MGKIVYNARRAAGSKLVYYKVFNISTTLALVKNNLFYYTVNNTTQLNNNTNTEIIFIDTKELQK